MKSEKFYSSTDGNKFAVCNSRIEHEITLIRNAMFEFINDNELDNIYADIAYLFNRQDFRDIMKERIKLLQQNALDNALID